MFHSEPLFFILPESDPLHLAEGLFAKRVLIVVREEPQAPGNKDFLGKILAAANLSLANDTRLIALPENQTIAISRVLRQQQAEQVLVFGVPPAQLGLRIAAPFYTPLHFYGRDWLFSEPLSLLEPDKAKKGLLWTGLKQLFKF